jgi:hypothetical protein
VRGQIKELKESSQRLNGETLERETEVLEVGRGVSVIVSPRELR